jgi:8-oxo-dGTP diphosphatase
MAQTDSLELYTVALLFHSSRYLMLRRSPQKAFAPEKWTGIGGHVEKDELNQLRAAALREVQEEAGILPEDIANFVLRRTLLVHRPDQPIAVLLYFTGEIEDIAPPACPEGTLAWKEAAEFSQLDIIETTAPVLNCLVDDIQRDPFGMEPLPVGLAVFNPAGDFQSLIWG